MIAVRQFVRDLDPAQLSGTIVACLQSSPVAFEQRSAFRQPARRPEPQPVLPRRRRRRPDRAAGGLAVGEPADPCRLFVDCHCGDLPEVLDSFTGVSPGPGGTISEQRPRPGRLLRRPPADHRPHDGSTIEQVALAGIPAVLVEVGGEGRWSQEQADIQRHGLHRVAALVGILPARPAAGRGCPSTRMPLTCSRPARPLVPRGHPGNVGQPGHPPGPPGGCLRRQRPGHPGPGGGVLTYGLGSLAAARGGLLASISRPRP